MTSIMPSVVPSRSKIIRLSEMKIPGFENAFEKKEVILTDRVRVFNVYNMDASKLEFGDEANFYDGFKLIYCMRPSSIDIGALARHFNYGTNIRGNALNQMSILGNKCGITAKGRVSAIAMHKRMLENQAYDSPIIRELSKANMYLQEAPFNRIGLVCFCVPKACHAQNYAVKLAELMRNTGVALNLPTLPY